MAGSDAGYAGVDEPALYLGLVPASQPAAATALQLVRASAQPVAIDFTHCQSADKVCYFINTPPNFECITSTPPPCAAPLGVQAGYVRLHELNQNTGLGAPLVKQTTNGQSLYVAGTGRLPLGASFALTGKLGVSFDKVIETSPATAATNPLVGSKTSLLIGTGAENALNRSVSFTVELESYGKISDQVKGNTFAIGARSSF